ncbi:MAG TPA: hypothetical protein VHD56_01230 [Tepidisphaeraceae bacterium]|nr:hypothetical protein [Tepidisphaeraceae bacterium]
MSGKRIGECLSGFVPLSGHDIEEILSEQGATGRRFGDIALQLGLCTPEDVWRAWCSQLAEKPRRVDLDHFAIDSQAVEYVPMQVALRFHIMPLRVLGDELVIAIDEAAYPEAAREVMAILGRKAKFVFSTHAQIAKALRSHYRQSNAA